MSIAKDMINGLCCQWCGIYFESAHGYPVLCHDCFDEDIDDANEAGLQRATIDEL